MAIYKRDIASINLETGTIHRTFLNHSIGLKDQKADHFGIRVFRDGEPVDLTGVSVQGVFMPPQGDPIAITSGNIVSGNEAEVVLPQACYNYDGQFTLSIKLVDATNAVTGTMRIVDGMVDNTHASGTVAPTSAVPTYQEILSTYDAMVAATAAANGAIAATYSSSSTYKVGDYCIHDGGLYRCTTAITTAEAWTSGHWTAAKIGPDVSDLKSALCGLASLATEIPADADLNDYTTPGNYKAVTNAIASSITNKPSWMGEAFRLFVLATNVSSRVMQLIFPNWYDGVPQILARVYNNTAWSNWYEMNNKPSVDALRSLVNAIAENIDNAENGLMSDANVLNYSTCASGRLRMTDGAVVSATNQHYSDYIPVRYGMKVYRNFVLESTSYGDVYYDINKNIIEKLPSEIGTNTHTVPKGAAFVRFTIPNSMLVAGSETAVVTITTTRLANIEKRLIIPVVKTTKWLAMGDSITFGVYSAVDDGEPKEFVGDGWVQLLAKSFGYELTVMASRGMGYTAEVDGKDPLNGNNRINLDTLLTRTEALTDEFNLITLAFGVNDYNSPSVATLDTIALGLNDALQRLTTKWKNARIVVITPFNCCNTVGCTLQTKWNCNYPRGNPERTLADVADKIKECCDAFGVECINCTENFVLNVVNIAKTLSDDERLLPDKVHPSQEAHGLIAKTMAHHLLY